MRRPSVYFLRPVGERGPIKIGSSVDVEGRLKTYMAWSPLPLEVIATLQGGAVLERRFHAAFRAFHMHHEWFAPADVLVATIKAIQAGSFDIASLPAPQALVTARNSWSAQKRTGIALKAQSSRAMYEGLPFTAEVRVAYDTIQDLEGDAWERAAATLRAHYTQPRPRKAAA